MNLSYLIIFISTFSFSVFFTWLTIKIALKFNIVDKPGLERKIHDKPMPLMGGLAIFLSYFIILFLVRDKLLIGQLDIHHFIGFFIGAVFLLIGGILDDKYNLKPAYQFVFPFLAIASVIMGGVQIEKITNPFGGFIYLGYLSAVLIGLWLLGMMYTTKLLDGMDGLVSGVVGIGGLIIFLFTMTTKYFQPDIGLAALILASSCFGFLVFNWHPAKIFLGEGGSLLLGYILGVLAIISGGKIAVALLIMGIPILDVAWTIIRRLAAGKNPFKFADRKHLHFRIFDLGVSQRKTVLIFYLFSLIFGLSALFLQSKGKIYAFLVLFLLMLGIILTFNYADKKNS